MVTRSGDSLQAGRQDHASLLQEHLDRGYRAILFEPALESAYRDDQFNDGLKYLRINLVILIALVLAVVQVDFLVIPSFSATVPASIRIGVMVSIMVIAFGLSFVRRAPVWYPRIMTVLMTGALMSIAWVGLVGWRIGEERVFVRLIIATISIYFVMGLRFRHALIANLASVAFYVAAAREFGMPGVQMAQYLAMLLMTSVICAVGAYNLEHARRVAWLEGQLLKEIARRDGLTGINNRRRLDEHLEQVWQQGLRERKSVALLFVDIDSFKTYNDYYGHQAGDEALKAVALVQARFGRRPFDMAARFGGEEFAVVLFDTGQQEALKLGNAIIKEVRGLEIAHARSAVAPMLTVSIGISCLVPTVPQDAAALLRLADQALYKAKHGGGDRVHLVDPTAADASIATVRAFG